MNYGTITDPNAPEVVIPDIPQEEEPEKEAPQSVDQKSLDDAFSELTKRKDS